MSIMPSPEVNAMLFILTGERLLQADEDMAYESRTPYAQLGQQMQRLSELIEKSVKQTAKAMPEDVGREYVRAMNMLIDDGGRNYLREFGEQLEQIAEGRRKASMDIMESKWQVIAEVIRLLVEIAIYMALSYFTGGASLTQIALAKARSRFAILTLLSHLLQRTHLLPTLTEAFQEAFLSFVVRLGMMTSGPEGRRPDGFDWKKILQDGAFGAMAGFFTSVFHQVASNIVRGYDKNFLKNNDEIDFRPPPRTHGTPDPSSHSPGSGVPDPQVGKGGSGPGPKGTDGPGPKENGPNAHGSPGGSGTHTPPPRISSPPPPYAPSPPPHTPTPPSTGALVGHHLVNESSLFIASGSGETLAELLHNGLFYGNWSVNPLTFVGAGISNRVNSLLDTGAMNTGANLRNVVDGLRGGGNPPGASSASNPPGSSGSSDEADGGPETVGRGGSAGAGSGGTPPRAGPEQATAPPEVQEPLPDPSSGALDGPGELDSADFGSHDADVDAGTAGRGDVMPPSPERDLWQQVHTGSPEARAEALRELAELRGGLPPSSAETDLRGGLQQSFGDPDQVRVLPGGDSPTVADDTRRVQDLFSSLGPDVLTQPPPRPEAFGGGVHTSGVAPGAEGAENGLSPTGGPGTSGSGVTRADIDGAGATRPDANGPAPGPESAGPNFAPNGTDAGRPVTDLPSDPSAETSPDSRTEDHGDPTNGAVSGSTDAPTHGSTGTPATGATAAPTNEPSTERGSPLAAGDGPVLTPGSPLTVVVSEGPLPYGAPDEAARLLDSAGSDSAVVLGPPVPSPSAGPTGASPTAPAASPTGPPAAASPTARPGTSPAPAPREAALLTRDGPGGEVRVQPLSDSGQLAAVTESVHFPGADVLLPLSEAFGPSGSLGPRAPEPESSGPPSRPATESTNTVGTHAEPSALPASADTSAMAPSPVAPPAAEVGVRGEAGPGPRINGAVPDVDAIEPVSESESESVSGGRGGDLGRPDLDLLVSEVGRELDRLLGPDRSEVARDEVVRVHDSLPVWRQAQPVGARVEAITQTLLAGEPAGLRGGGSMPSSGLAHTQGSSSGLPGTSSRGETVTRVAFPEGSQELSDAARAEVDSVAADAVRRGAERARAGLPLPVVEVVGRGNGSRLPGRDRGETARVTGRARAAVVADAFRAAVERHAAALPRDVARHVGSKLFTVNEHSRGRDPEAGTADQGRSADVTLRDPGQVVVGQEAGGIASVPRVVHAVWFGGELGSAARENLLAWRDRVSDAGWQVVLWGDAGALSANAGFINDLTASGGASVATVDRGIFPAGDGGDAAAGDRAHALMNWALGKGGYAMASDIARYGILHRDGGVYVDVDIHPGEVTLPSEGLAANPDGLPFLAPQLRDSGQFRRVLSELNSERAAEGQSPLRADDVSAMPSVIERQYAEGQFNNNFIVTPAGSSFMRGLLTELRDPGDPSLQMRDVHQDAAELTGPNYIRRAITSALEASGNWPFGSRWAHMFRSSRVRFAPEAQQRWAGLGWLTAESEAQEGGGRAPGGRPSASEQTVLPSVTGASPATSTVPGPPSAQGPDRPGARGVVPDVDAIEPVSESESESESVSGGRGGDLGRPDLDLLVSEVGRELDRLLGPDRSEVARDEVVRVHDSLPVWRQAQPVRARVEAITQTLLAGEPAGLRGGGPMPSASHGYSNAEELLGDLRESARVPDIRRAPGERTLGPNLFGGLDAPQPGPHVGSSTGLGPDGVVPFLDGADMVPGRPEPSARPRASHQGMPQVVHAIWLGGPLRPDGPASGFWRRFGDAGQRHGQEALFTLWTDVPRGLVEQAVASGGRSSDPRLRDVHAMVGWARDNNIRLVNVDEVFHAGEPLRLNREFRTELAKHTGPGWSAASDVLRWELLHRFGGLYSDGDNVIDSLDALHTVPESAEQYAVHSVGQDFDNAAIAMVPGQPRAAEIIDGIAERYGTAQPGLFGPMAGATGFWTGEAVVKVRRNSVMSRTGPDAVKQLLERNGAPSVISLPRIQGVDVRSDMSWLKSTGRQPPPMSRAETLAFTQDMVESLARGLFGNRPGDLHLTNFNDALSQHPDPELVAESVVRFLAEREDFRSEVSGATIRRRENEGPDTLVTLPPAVRNLLAHDPSGMPPLGAETGGWFVAEQSVPARLVSDPVADEASVWHAPAEVRPQGAQRPDTPGSENVPWGRPGEPTPWTAQPESDSESEGGLFAAAPRRPVPVGESRGVEPESESDSESEGGLFAAAPRRPVPVGESRGVEPESESDSESDDGLFAAPPRRPDPAEGTHQSPSWTAELAPPAPATRAGGPGGRPAPPFVTDWSESSQVSFQQRSAAIRAIDVAVQRVSPQPRAEELQRVLRAVETWKAQKTPSSRRWDAVAQLERAVHGRLRELSSRQPGASVPPVSEAAGETSSGPAGRRGGGRPVRVGGFGPASGFEAELHEFRLQIPPGENDSAYDVLVTRPGLLHLTLDHVGDVPILEVVTAPARSLSGAAQDGRAEHGEVLDAFRDVLARLRGARQGISLEQLFPAEAGYEVDTLAADLAVRSNPPGTGTVLVHHTGTAPLAGAPAFIQHVTEHMRQELPQLQHAAGHARDGLRYAEQGAERFRAWLARSPEWAGQQRPWDAAELQGALALGYTQVAAAADGRSKHLKELTAVASRDSLGAIRAALGPAPRAFLEAEAAWLADTFVETLPESVQQRGEVLERPLKGAAAPVRLGHYLDNLLHASPEHRVGQYEALTIRTEFGSLDDNRDGEQPRIDPPVVRMEARHYATRYSDAETVAAEFDTLSDLSVQLYNEARELHGLPRVGEPLVPEQTNFPPTTGASPTPSTVPEPRSAAPSPHDDTTVSDLSAPERSTLSPEAVRELAHRLPVLTPDQRRSELGRLSHADRDVVAADPGVVDALRDGLSAAEFARTASQLMVHVPSGVHQPVSARQEAEQRLLPMLNDPEVTARLLHQGVRILVAPRDVPGTELAPFRSFNGARQDGRWFAAERGWHSAGRVLAAEENLLGETTDVPGAATYHDGYSTITHEFAHALHHYGLSAADRKLIADGYRAMLERGTGPDGPVYGPSGSRSGPSYAARNEYEYFAQLSNAYLGTNEGIDPFTGQPRENRAHWVREHEPDMLPLLERVYGADPTAVSPGPANPTTATAAENETYAGFRALFDRAEETLTAQPHPPVPGAVRAGPTAVPGLLPTATSTAGEPAGNPSDVPADESTDVLLSPPARPLPGASPAAAATVPAAASVPTAPSGAPVGTRNTGTEHDPKAGFETPGYPLDVREVVGDGDCFFRSVLEGAAAQGVPGFDGLDVQGLRRELRDHLRNNPEQAAGFFLERTDPVEIVLADLEPSAAVQERVRAGDPGAWRDLLRDSAYGELLDFAPTPAQARTVGLVETLAQTAWRTSMWNSPFGDLIPEVLAATRGVDLRVVSPLHTQRVNPDADGMPLFVAYNDRNHYEALEPSSAPAPVSGATTLSKAPDPSPVGPKDPTGKVLGAPANSPAVVSRWGALGTLGNLADAAGSGGLGKAFAWMPRVALPEVNLPSLALPSVSLPSLSLPAPHARLSGVWQQLRDWTSGLLGSTRTPAPIDNAADVARQEQSKPQPVPVETQLDRNRPPRILPGTDRAPALAPPESVTFADGSRLHPEYLNPADGTGDRSGGLMPGLGVQTLRDSDRVAERILAGLPERVRRTFDHTELRRMLHEEPEAFTAPHGARFVSREKSGRGFETTVRARPRHRWERFADPEGFAYTMEGAHRGTRTTGVPQSVSRARRLAGAVSLGPPLNWMVRVGGTFGRTRRTDYNTGTQQSSETEWRSMAGSHLHLDDVSYQVDVHEVALEKSSGRPGPADSAATPAPSAATPTGSTPAPAGFTGATGNRTPPDDGTDARQTPRGWRRTPLRQNRFDVRNGLTWRLPDALTEQRTAPPSVPTEFALPSGARPRVTDTTALHFRDAPQTPALDMFGARPGSSAHRALVSWLRPSRLLSLFPQFPGEQAGPELTRGARRRPLGHVVVDRVESHTARLVTEATTIELRDTGRFVQQNDRSHSTGTSVGVQFSAGPQQTLLLGPVDLRIQGGPLVGVDLATGRTLLVGGSAARKTTGVTKGTPTALYQVDRTLYLRTPGEPADAARPIRVTTLDWIPATEARRLAGWDTAPPAHSDSAPAGIRPQAAPEAPPYLSKDHPTHLGQVRVEGFTPESATTASRPASPSVEELADTVLDTLAESYPGLFRPRWQRRFFGELAARYPRLNRLVRGGEYSRTALQNERQVREALNWPSLKQALERLATSGVPVTVTEQGALQRTQHTVRLRADLRDRQYEGSSSERGLRSGTASGQQLGGGEQASSAQTVGVQLGLSPRDHETAPETGWAKRIGWLTPGIRHVWSKQHATSAQTTVSTDHLTAQTGVHRYSYRVELHATIANYRRPRALPRLATLGVLGTGAFVRRIPEQPLFDGRPATIGRVELGAPAAHSPTSVPASSAPTSSVPAVPAPTTPTPTPPAPLSPAEAEQLIEGTSELPAPKDAPAEWTRELLSHPFVLQGMEGAQQRLRAVEEAAREASGDSWHVTTPGAPAYEALHRAMENLATVGHIGQLLGAFGFRSTGLNASGPLQNHRFQAAVRGLLHRPRVLGRPAKGSFEATLGSDRTLSGSVSTSSRTTVGMQNSLLLQQIDGHEPVHGTYAAGLQYGWGKGSSASRSLSNGRSTTLSYAGRQYALLADLTEHLAVRDRWSAFAGLFGTGSAAAVQRAFTRLSSRVGDLVPGPRRAAGRRHTVQDALLLHLPMQDAIELGLAEDGMGTGTPRMLAGGYQIPSYLRQRGFLGHPSGQLDARRIAGTLLPRLQRLGVSAEDRAQVQHMLSPDMLLGQHAQLTADGVGLPIRYARGADPRRLSDGRPAEVRFHLTPVTKRVERLRNGFEIEDDRTLGQGASHSRSYGSGTDASLGVSPAAAVDRGTTGLLAAGPSLQGAAAQQEQSSSTRADGTASTPGMSTTQSHAQLVTEYELSVTVTDHLGNSLLGQSGRDARVSGPVGRLRELLPTGVLLPQGDAAHPALGEAELKAPRRGAQPLAARDATPEGIEAWRSTGSELPLDDVIGTGFVAVDMLGSQNVGDAMTLATGLAEGLGDGGLGGELGPAALADAVRRARETPLTGLGTAPAQAMQEATGQTGLNSSLRGALGPNGRRLPQLSSASLFGQSHTADPALYAKLGKQGARLLAVEHAPSMEGNARSGTDTAQTAAAQQSTESTFGPAPMAGTDEAGVISPGVSAPLSSTVAGEALGSGAGLAGSSNPKAGTGRAMLFALPVRWLAVAEAHRRIGDSSLARTFGHVPRGPRAVEAETTALVWVRQDLAADLGLLDEASFPAAVRGAWDGVAAAQADLVAAESQYYDARARSRAAWTAMDSAQQDLARGDSGTTTATSALSDEALERVREWRQARADTELWAGRTEAAAQQRQRLHAAASRLTESHYTDPATEAGGSPSRPPAPAYEPPVWRERPPAEYRVSGGSGTERRLTPAQSPAAGANPRPNLVAHPVTHGGASFFHALTAAAKYHLPRAPLVSTGFWSRFATSWWGSPADVETVRARLLSALADPSNRDVLLALAPGRADAFTQAELDAAGVRLEGAHAAEFRAVGTVPEQRWLTDEERSRLAIAALSRDFDEADAHTWDHWAADVLPALAARELGTPLTVVTEDGRAHRFLPAGMDPATEFGAAGPEPTLFLVDGFFQVALPEGARPWAPPETSSEATAPSEGRHPSHTRWPWTATSTDETSRYTLERDGTLRGPDGTVHRQGPAGGPGNGFFDALARGFEHAAQTAGLPDGERRAHREQAAQVRRDPARMLGQAPPPGEPNAVAGLLDAAAHDAAAELARHAGRAGWRQRADETMARWVAAATGVTLTLVDEDGTAHTYPGTGAEGRPHLVLRRRGGDFVPLLAETGPPPTRTVDTARPPDEGTRGTGAPNPGSRADVIFRTLTGG